MKNVPDTVSAPSVEIEIYQTHFDLALKITQRYNTKEFRACPPSTPFHPTQNGFDLSNVVGCLILKSDDHLL